MGSQRVRHGWVTFTSQFPRPLLTTSLFLWVCSFFIIFTSWFYLLDSMYAIYSICLSLSGLFHLAQSRISPSMLLQMANFHSFLWLSTSPLNTCSKYSLFIHLSTDILGFLHIWAIANNAAMIMGAHVSFSVFVLFCLPWNGITGS